jgi:hypothetical protein
MSHHITLSGAVALLPLEPPHHFPLRHHVSSPWATTSLLLEASHNFLSDNTPPPSHEQSCYFPLSPHVTNPWATTSVPHEPRPEPAYYFTMSHHILQHPHEPPRHFPMCHPNTFPSAITSVPHEPQHHLPYVTTSIPHERPHHFPASTTKGWLNSTKPKYRAGDLAGGRVVYGSSSRHQYGHKEAAYM